MAEIRLYRDFYCINATLNDVALLNTSQVKIDPQTLSARSAINNSGATVENNITVTQESTGVYYASLNPTLYTFDNIYELFWDVVYIPGAPQRTLVTRFKLNPVNVGENLTVEVLAVY